VPAVRVLIHLSQSGPIEQGRLAEEPDIEPYAMSRLLTKLETHRYVKRKRSGNDEIVILESAFEEEARPQESKALSDNAHIET
jgi:DNA-binding MarR family transcriptional regulator